MKYSRKMDGLHPSPLDTNERHETLRTQCLTPLNPEQEICAQSQRTGGPISLMSMPQLLEMSNFHSVYQNQLNQPLLDINRSNHTLSTFRNDRMNSASQTISITGRKCISA